MAKKKNLTLQEIKEKNKLLAIHHFKKYPLGRIVVQTGEYAGLKKNRIGWVIDTWPKTMVLFEDGDESYVLQDIDRALTATDEIEKNLEKIKKKIQKSKVEKIAPVKRKSTY